MDLTVNAMIMMNSLHNLIRIYRELGRDGERCYLKRSVFSLRLKVVKVCAVLTSTGGSLHHQGARTAAMTIKCK